MLIEQLRALEEHGLVSRQSSGQDARGVDYVLTPLGRSLQPVLTVLQDWGEHHAQELEQTDQLLSCKDVVRDSVRDHP